MTNGRMHDMRRPWAFLETYTVPAAGECISATTVTPELLSYLRHRTEKSLPGKRELADQFARLSGEAADEVVDRAWRYDPPEF